MVDVHPPNFATIMQNFTQNFNNPNPIYNILDLPIVKNWHIQRLNIIKDFFELRNISYIIYSDSCITINYRNNEWTIMWNVFDAQNENWFAEILFENSYVFTTLNAFRNITNVIDNYID